VRWDGTEIRHLREEYSKRLVYIGHAAAVKDDLTAAENLRIACTLAGHRVAPLRIQQALDAFELADLREAAVARTAAAAVLARLVVSESMPLWLLDEPYAALDAAAGRLVEELIDGHVARGGAVVFTTHQDTRVRASRLSTWMLEAARCVVVRDLLVAWRRRSDVATALLFFVISPACFRWASAPKPDLLRSIAPG